MTIKVSKKSWVELRTMVEHNPAARSLMDDIEEAQAEELTMMRDAVAPSPRSKKATRSSAPALPSWPHSFTSAVAGQKL